MLPFLASIGGLVNSNAPDTQTVTTGTSGGVGTRLRGFISGSIGSCSDGTSNMYGGASVLSLNWSEAADWIVFEVSGSQPNSGWTQVSINGTVLTRAAASYSTGATTKWTWSVVYTVAAQPFGSAGATIPCVFS